MVRGLYIQLNAILESQLVAHYDMKADTVNDQTGNGKHATLTCVNWEKEPDTQFQRNYILLNGNSDYLRVPMSTSTEYVYLEMKRLNGDLTGIILDGRPLYNKSVCN
ncbi:hypothetical protein CWR48_04045 [Oceanobacillus arenosus]|uniref:Uncharacterized protein n=1 Tax=Oceanobacillus arenosus TaxID=1229153 RepID=A0A3D8Q294_9BACI|nr:hypothetical protein [Oceanobacillus arenosus]RDW21135.1 hypothetical protein CWR48_04045 [Oceanobacillus arenosus]